MAFSIRQLEDPEKECNISHNNLELAISIFIACGLLVSYLPQYKMIQCCAYVASGECFENTLGVIQLALQWSMFTLIFILFLLYFPEHRKLTTYIPHIHYGNPPSTRSLEWRISLGVTFTVLTHFLLVTLISAYFLATRPTSELAIYWADLLGVISMLLASVQYIPQIWRTWRRKAVGALSIPMMLMQTPGSFLFVYSLAIRPGTNWTSWIVFLVTGCLQGILLIMCIAWHFRAKRLGYGPFYVGDTEVIISPDSSNERTGLLADGRPNNARNIYVKKTTDQP
ncbi:hypothetical protein G9A89_021168 [Geosiphon pyriformis]|nr:hypothetical protein G9A89_021168 [Geosiphon pyriformis]